MTATRRTPRRTSIGAEALETRNLLNAHVPTHAVAHVTRHPAAHVAAAPLPKPAAPLKAPHLISGTLTGIGPGTSNPNNSNQGYDTYSATAATKHGVATYYGTDAYTSVPISPTTAHDTYFNGFTVLYLAGNNEISINYVGSGPYPTHFTGPYSATFKGEAIGITGSLTGHVYSFNATLTGDATTNAVAIKFTLKD